jgi:UDP-glucose 4-epimerase
LLELCRELGTKRVLFASTGGAIYGEQDVYPAAETHPARPISPYGVAKLSVEHYLHYYSVQYGLVTTALRYANVYGPRQNPHGEAGVVAIFSHKLLASEQPTIYGGGTQTRDYVYVGDVARANLLAFEKELTGAYNVGTGIETSVNELFEAMCRHVGFEKGAIDAAARPGEQARSSIDSTMLTKATGWTPQISLADGLSRTIDSFKT